MLKYHSDKQGDIVLKSDLKPPILLEFSKKPKILYVADVPNWSFHIKGNQYKKYLPQYDIDIGFTTQELQADYKNLYWQEMIANNHYDVIWQMHSHNIFGKQDLINFVYQMNKKGTQVVLTQNEVTPVEAIKADIQRYAAFNSLSVNNPWAYENFKSVGFDKVHKTYDGVDLHVFGPDIPVQKRKFKVLFCSSKMRLEHKGYHIWQKTREILQNEEGIEFVELITDSFNNKRTPEEMNVIYNECQVYVCLSISEGGPCTLQEAAACGVVPIMTKVGYCDYFENLFVIPREAKVCAEKILYLKNNHEVLYKMSHGISKEILPWHDKLMSQHWGYFLQDAVMRNKGCSFV